jgi:IclR family KDG regulon transcriptional repressor
MPAIVTSSKDSSQTLARGLQLLQFVGDGHEGLPVRDLAQAVGLPRSVVQRLLHTLEAEGFLEKHPSQVGYRLAIKLWGLGCAAVHRLSVRDVARSYLEDLAGKTNEMTKLGVLDGTDVVYVDRIDCSLAVRAYVPLGGRAPAHSVATGKAILAFLPAARLAEIERVISPTHHIAKDDQPLAAQLEQIRRRGYAVNRGEWEEAVGAIAAPIFGAEGEVAASIGIILPSHRLTAAKAAQMGAWTAAAAAEISRKLGHGMDRAPPRIKRAV